MKQGLRKITAAILMACLVVGFMPVQNVLAENMADDEITNAETEVSEGSKKTEDTEVQSSSNMQVLEIGESSEPEQEEEDIEGNDLQEEAKDVPEDAECKINHIVIVSPYLETPGTEEIMVSYGDGSESVSEMFLRIKGPNGQIYDWEQEKHNNELYLFSKSFTDNNEAGTYVIESLGFTDEGGEHIFELADYGMDARFGVDEEYSGYEELQPLDEEDEEESDESVSATVVSLDSVEDTDSATEQIVDALNNAENEVQVDGEISTFSAITPYASSSNVVVALDPGHDSTHAGAQSAGGLKEEDLTLKIANYCKEELETYSGVSVYMTRTSAACPYPETKNQSSGTDISYRVKAAVQAGASIYVSLHLNSATSTSAKGAEVIIQNSNWRPGVAEEGKALAEAILDELADIGVTMRSTKIYSKNSQDGTKYEDGSTSDYYAVHTNCKKNNIPGIIVEHAFLSNTSDVNNYLSTEAGLKKLGVADATGIAKYLGLGTIKTPTMKSATASNDGIKVTWDSVSDVTGYRVYRKPEGGDWSGIATTTSTSYTDTSNLEIGKTYYYTVRAFTGTESEAMANQFKAAYWSGFESPGVSAKAKGCLTTPSLSKATASSGNIIVSWSSVSGASGYRVYRKTSGGSWAGIATVDNKTSYTDSDKLDIGTTYYYTVRAYKGDWSTASANQFYSNYWSDFDSAGVSAKAVGSLSTPSLKSATASFRSITVTWNSVSDANGYRIYRKPSGGSWAGIATVNSNSTSYTDTSDLTDGKTYYYTVRAYKGDWATASANQFYSNYWSDFDSTGVSAVAVNTITTPVLSSATASSGSIKVTWKSVSEADGYRVFRKPAGGSWAGIGNTTSTSYTDSDKLEVGTTYYYTVRAYNGTLSDALAHTFDSEYWSDFQASGISAKAVSALSTPTLKSATASAGSITVTWGSVSGASGYRVYRKPSGGSWSGIATTNSNSTSYTDSSSLSAGTKYYYTVRAFTGTESTAMSNQFYTTYWSDFDSSGVSATAIAVLSTPVLTGTSVDNEGIKVTWNSNSEASGYRVFRKTSGGSWSGIGNTTSSSFVDTNGGSSGTTYYYTVRAYRGSQSTALANTFDSAYWSDFDSKGVSGSAYEIAGTTTTTKAKMVTLFNNSGKKYPSSELSVGGASTIDELAQIYIDEAAAEGIKAEVAWCQMILETGYLQYGGQVSVEQFNFAGLGATDGGAAGEAFSSVREGVRAQIQHLKAYATTSALNNTCVDTRFNLVTRGCAKYVEILGQQENPKGYGWATGAGYGAKIINLINQL